MISILHVSLNINSSGETKNLLQNSVLHLPDLKNSTSQPSIPNHSMFSSKLVSGNGIDHTGETLDTMQCDSS